MANIKQAVKGRESEVLQSLGIEPNKGKNDHIDCPYPSHGGKSDWRWDKGNARAFCSCIQGSHSIFDVVMSVRGVTFVESLDIVADVIGVDNGPSKRWPSSKPGALMKPPANLSSPDLAMAYLSSRLKVDSPVIPSTKIVGWREFPYFDAGPKHVGDWPCVAFETVSADGRSHAHRIYVGPDGQGKADLGKNRDPKKSASKVDPSDNTSGCSVTWGDPTMSPVVLLCEGIETGAAIAYAVSDSLTEGKVCVASALSTAGIKGFIPWPASKIVIVAADRDPNGAGEKAARSFCMAHHETFELEIALPGRDGEKIDFLDMLLRDGANAVRDHLNDGDPFVPGDDDDVPTEPKVSIHVEAGRVDQRVKACEEVLGDAGTIYQRGAYLTRVARISDPASSQDIERAAGSLVMMIAEAPHLQAELCRIADFKRWSSRQEDWVSTDPSIGDIRALMAGAGQWPTIPAITGITEVPVIADDGRIIDQTGHDDSTGIYFDPGRTSFPKIPERPSREDALKALAILKGLIGGFPFIDDVAVSVAISQILTPFKRPFLRAAPMFLNTAPKMGSGKTLLASVVSYVATGSPPASMSQEENRDEEKKRMLALLMSGSAVTVIDNIERPLKSDTLCTVLTEPVWKERILGKSEEIKVGTATTWIATGNNLEVSGDLSTRSLVCTIDPECEHPEERDFKINLHEYVPAHRGEIAAACLTILKAYWVARQSGNGVEGLSVFGRFEQWSSWIRESIVWLGMADPCQARKLVEARDSVRDELGALLEAWYGAFGEEPMTLNLVVNTVADAETEALVNLKDALLGVCSDTRGNTNTRKLGKYISKAENRIESGYKFVRRGEEKRAISWSVLHSVGGSSDYRGFDKTLPMVSYGENQVIDSKGKVSYREFGDLNRVRNQETPYNSKIVSNSESILVEGTKRTVTPKHTITKNKALF